MPILQQNRLVTSIKSGAIAQIAAKDMMQTNMISIGFID